MISIAWAILCAAFIVKPPRNPNEPNYTANNMIETILFLTGFFFLVVFSLVGR